MKSPMDNVIQDVQLSSVRGPMPAKPAGGKALMRLIALLDSRGLHDLADQFVTTSSTDETREQVLAARDRLSSAPRQLGEQEDATRKPISPETAHAKAMQIAEQYAAPEPGAAPSSTGGLAGINAGSAPAMLAAVSAVGSVEETS